LSACAPAPSPTPAPGASAPGATPFPTAALPPPTATLTTGPSLALPPPPACADLACFWTTLNIARLQGHAPDANVLKLFTAAADSERGRIYVASILTRPIAILDQASAQWLGMDSGIDGSAYRYLYLDPVANYLYILDDSHHQLFRLNLNTNEMAGPASLPEHVGWVAVDTGRARLYLTTPDAPTFRAVDGRTLETLYAVTPEAAAGPIALTAQGDALYVLNLRPQRGGEIFHLDPETGRVVKTIPYTAPPGQRPRFLATDDARAHLVVATDHIVQVLDLAGQEVSAFSLPRVGELQDLAFDPVRGHLIALWLASPSEGQVAAIGGRLQVYDLNTGRTLHDLAFGAKPHRLTLDAANGQLYIPEGDASVLWRIDASSYATATPLRLGDAVEQVVAADGGRRVFLTSRLGGSYLLVYDLATGGWETFTAGTWPIPIRTDAGGERLFVLNAWDSTLSVYEATSPRTPLATIPLGLPRGTTDRLPDLAVDTAHRRAYAAYPEFGKIAVVDWEAGRAIGEIEVAGFPTGDTGGGPGQLQVAVNEAAGLLYAFRKDERRLTVYDAAGYTLRADQDLRSLDWRAMQGAPGTGNLFVDAGRDRLFLGPFELSAQTGQPTGRRLARGQQVLALDEVAGAYWAVGVEEINGQETNVLVLLARDTLQARAAQPLSPASGIGESFTLDLAQRRLYVGRMTTAEVEMWVLGGPASSGTAPPTPPPSSTPASATPTVPPAESAGAPNTYWVTNPASNARLYVQIVRPQNASGPLPALVLIPGGTDYGGALLRTGKAQALADAGFVIVLFDPDGRGRSEGEENLNGHIHQDGLAAVIRFAAALPDVDASRIGLVTYSYGITMGSGALARHPDLPVRFLIDWEGPANRRYTTGDCRGQVGRIRWPSCSDDAFWSEREAATFIAQIRVPYQRIQSERDHAQPVVTHAVEMVNAAVAGGVPWVRLNDNPPNQTYDPAAPPRMLPEATDRHLEELIARYARELFGQ
ncbi:MAG: hypothetical protein H5T65_11025, partial [Chloroflexi bacterium]|nr:hypothetical protein [Chloroflexota bacterium]